MKAADSGLEVNVIHASIEQHPFGQSVYDLVISAAAVLNFFRKKEGQEMIRTLRAALKPGGVIYVSVSTPDDPAHQRARRGAEKLDGDDFYYERYGRWVTAYRLADLRECLAGCDILLEEEREIQDHHGTPHKHRMAYIAGRRR
jgi:SAM-dependent methyltransferase